MNSLRESFDLPGVPMRVTVKSGKNPYADPDDDRAPDVKKYGRGGPAKTYGKAAAKPVVRPRGLPGNRGRPTGGAGRPRRP